MRGNELIKQRTRLWAYGAGVGGNWARERERRGICLFLLVPRSCHFATRSACMSDLGPFLGVFKSGNQEKKRKEKKTRSKVLVCWGCINGKDERKKEKKKAGVCA